MRGPADCPSLPSDCIQCLLNVPAFAPSCDPGGPRLLSQPAPVARPSRRGGNPFRLRNDVAAPPAGSTRIPGLPAMNSTPPDAFTIERHGDITLIVASRGSIELDRPGDGAAGSEDHAGAPSRPGFARSVRPGPVDYFGSIFLRVLIRCWKLAPPKGGPMVLVGRLGAGQRAAPGDVASTWSCRSTRPAARDGGPARRLRPAAAGGRPETVDSRADRPMIKASGPPPRAAARSRPCRPPPEPSWESMTASTTVTTTRGSGFLSGTAPACRAHHPHQRRRLPRPVLVFKDWRTPGVRWTPTATRSSGSSRSGNW